MELLLTEVRLPSLPAEDSDGDDSGECNAASEGEEEEEDPVDQCVRPRKRPTPPTVLVTCGELRCCLVLVLSLSPEASSTNVVH